MQFKLKRLQQTLFHRGDRPLSARSSLGDGPAVRWGDFLFPEILFNVAHGAYQLADRLAASLASWARRTTLIRGVGNRTLLARTGYCGVLDLPGGRGR